jgi:hypothetical protein
LLTRFDTAQRKKRSPSDNSSLPPVKRHPELPPLRHEELPPPWLHGLG